MTTETTEPIPRFERFRIEYPSGTVIESYCPGGAPLEEVRTTHPMATVSAVEDSLEKTR
jgi:hypothetical protein